MTFSNRLKIVSLNIEKDKHLSRIIPFLRAHRPDVILLQEVFLHTVSVLEKELAMKGTFSLMKILTYEQQRPFGLATFSSLPLVTSFSTYFHRDTQSPPIGPEGYPLKQDLCILVTNFQKENKNYCLINTHFTWSPDGQDTPRQHEDLASLLQLLDQVPEFVLFGDFNAPRGGIIFNKIASTYKDNIPPHITTTLDKNLHRAGDLQLVVDGLFSTPQYHIEDVQIIDGLSDHCAISAHIL